MDIFLDNLGPKEFESIEFLENLKRIMTENGILLFNRMALRTEDKEYTKAFFEEKFKAVFPKATIIELGGNWMLCNQHF